MAPRPRQSIQVDRLDDQRSATVPRGDRHKSIIEVARSVRRAQAARLTRVWDRDMPEVWEHHSASHHHLQDRVRSLITSNERRELPHVPALRIPYWRQIMPLGELIDNEGERRTVKRPPSSQGGGISSLTKNYLTRSVQGLSHPSWCKAISTSRRCGPPPDAWNTYARVPPELICANNRRYRRTTCSPRPILV